MNMLWPGFLLLLGLIPVIIGIYIWMQRRRRRFAVRYSSLSLVRAALPQQSEANTTILTDKIPSLIVNTLAKGLLSELGDLLVVSGKNR